MGSKMFSPSLDSEGDRLINEVPVSTLLYINSRNQPSKDQVLHIILHLHVKNTTFRLLRKEFIPSTLLHSLHLLIHLIQVRAQKYSVYFQEESNPIVLSYPLESLYLNLCLPNIKPDMLLSP